MADSASVGGNVLSPLLNGGKMPSNMESVTKNTSAFGEASYRENCPPPPPPQIEELEKGDSAVVNSEVDMVHSEGMEVTNNQEETNGDVGVVNSDGREDEGVVNSDSEEGVVNSTDNQEDELGLVGVVNLDSKGSVGVVTLKFGGNAEITNEEGERVDVGVVNSDSGGVIDSKIGGNAELTNEEDEREDVGVVNSADGGLVDGSNAEVTNKEGDREDVGVINSDSDSLASVPPLSGILKNEDNSLIGPQPWPEHHVTNHNNITDKLDDKKGVANHQDSTNQFISEDGNSDLPDVEMDHSEGSPNQSHDGVGVVNEKMDVVNHNNIATNSEDDPDQMGVADSNNTDSGPSGTTTEGVSRTVLNFDPQNDETGDVAKVEPLKRMTRAQKAIMESLATFGGSNFDSIAVKKVDFHAKLKKEANKLKEEETKERSGEQPSRKRPRTRLSIAREESLKNFQNTALGEGAKKKYPKVTLAKINSRNLSNGTQQSTARYQTRVKRSQAAAMDSFDGAVLDDLPVRKKAKLQLRKYALSAKGKSIQRSKCKHPNECQPDTGHKFTRLEKAKLEAIQSFGGSSLNNVLNDSKRKVSKTLNPSKPAKSKCEGDGTKSHDNTSESHEVPSESHDVPDQLCEMK